MILLLILFVDIPYELVSRLDDRVPSEEGYYLTAPSDALFVDGVLYVSDMKSHRVFVYDRVGGLRSFGGSGDAPGEFKHHPQFLELEKQVLMVLEWNRLRTSYFDLEGGFLRAHKRREHETSLSHLRLEPLNWDAKKKHKALLRDLEYDCLFGALVDDSDRGIHLSRYHLDKGRNNRLVLVLSSGVIRIYERPCVLIHEMPLPLAQFKAEVKPNPVVNQFVRARNPETAAKGFFHGVPVIDAAVCDSERVWVLVKDENLEAPPYYQQDLAAHNWLLEVNPTDKEILTMRQLPFPVNRIRYRDKHLILISRHEASVRVYKTD